MAILQHEHERISRILGDNLLWIRKLWHIISVLWGILKVGQKSPLTGCVNTFTNFGLRDQRHVKINLIYRTLWHISRLIFISNSSSLYIPVSTYFRFYDGNSKTLLLSTLCKVDNCISILLPSSSVSIYTESSKTARIGTSDCEFWKDT